jgi:hypothetical protein
MFGQFIPQEIVSMLRATIGVGMIALLLAASPMQAQSGADSVKSYFTGKQVVLKIDMPGTQKGVDLKFNQSPPMNWKDYSSRVKQFGAAIRKGDTVRVTTVVVKGDMIEFQLDGGGYGTFGDDTQTTVAAKQVEKSDYEKQLEQQISQTDDPDKKTQLQRDLDREQAKRRREQQANDRAAQVASQLKAEQVAEKRAQGGSRFNLRWKGSIPQDQLNPDAIMKLLADYVDFGSLQQASAPTPAAAAASAAVAPAAAPVPAPDSSPTAQLKRGMSLEDVTKLLGQGRQLSESTSSDNLKTQVFEYLPGDRRVEITYVDGLVVRFTIASR